MSKQNKRNLSESDKAMLAAYLRLTPEDREKVIAYVALLREARYSRRPSAVPHP